jgi:hypothetical protein
LTAARATIMIMTVPSKSIVSVPAGTNNILKGDHCAILLKEFRFFKQDVTFRDLIVPGE